MLRIRVLALLSALLVTGFIGAPVDLSSADARHGSCRAGGGGPVRRILGVSRRRERRIARRENRAAIAGSYASGGCAGGYGYYSHGEYGSYQSGGSAGEYNSGGGYEVYHSAPAQSGCRNCGRFIN